MLLQIHEAMVRLVRGKARGREFEDACAKLDIDFLLAVSLALNIL